ncbi:TPR repeat protein [Cylindrospermum sp. NIES-4074]|nr:TPR repeat protein [Cylindrospermum sp. NIES-4074]
MSNNYRKRSLTDRNRALNLFTDRHDLTRVFAGYLNDAQPAENILCFYGDGGNGKSLLLRFLETRCCKRLRWESWQGLQSKSDQEVTDYIEDLADSWEFAQVPAISQDFGLSPNGDDQPQDPFYGLLMLRRKLSRAATELNYRLRFPLYDFACIWYLKQKNRLTPEKLTELFPAEELDLLIEIGNAVSETSWGTIGKAVLGIFNKHLGENFVLYLQQRGIKAEDLQEIRQMDAETELINELPRYLAQDLNAAMSQKKAPQRIVLFFDTHEAFWGYQRNLPDTLFFQKDEWLRYFLAELELKAGIIAVVAGREAPRWNQAENFPIHNLDTHLVNHLSPVDADEYLRRAEVTNEELRKSVIAYGSVAVNQVHPFLLGLCADVVLQAKEQKVNITPADFPKTPETANKAKLLIELLLKHADREIRRAVHALSACRAFNFDIYRVLGENLHFQTTKVAFEILTEFSFVWDMQELGKDWYRIHDLLRRLDNEGDNEITQQAHEVLEKYHRQQGKVAEAIYHANRLDWLRGVIEWVDLFEQALKKSRYQQCRSLLEIRNELVIESDFQLGSVSQCEGNYLAILARYQEAQEEYGEAVAAYKQDLKFTPDDTATLNNLGVVLKSLGDLQIRLSLYSQALQSYNDAIAACDSLLTFAPNDNKVLSNKGNALQGLGELQTRLAQHSQALQLYSDAITAYNSALTLAPDEIYTLNNKGATLTSLGELQTQFAQHNAALKSYSEAITALKNALILDPDYITAINNLANTLQSLGDLRIILSQHTEALQCYIDAISNYKTALNLAPSYVNALNNQGAVLSKMGDLLTKLDNYQEALQSYSDAIAVYDTVLSLAPDYIDGLNNKGLMLQMLGNLQTQLDLRSEALQSYSDAMVAYNTALVLAPNYTKILNNKGLGLVRLSKLLLEVSQKQEAIQSLQEALVVFNRSLAIAPSSEYIRNLRDEFQEYLDNLD